MLKKLISLIASAIMCCCLASTAQAIPFNQIGNIYFFGDSLTDSGFNDLWPGLPAGKAPTFTTFGGYIWSQYVARDIKGILLPIYPGPAPADVITNNICPTCSPGFYSGTLNGFDYASAGSTTNSIGFQETWAPSLFTQVTNFLNSNPVIQPNDIFFIWEGANDLLAELGPTTTQLQLLTAANTATDNIVTNVARLSGRGAKRFVIISLPNIGSSPLIASFGSEELVQDIKNLSFTFDSMLNQKLGALLAKTNIKVRYINVYKLLDNVILAANAGKPYYVAGQPFLFTNTTTPVCSTLSAISCPETSQGHVFADALHPTDMAHRLISLQVETEILNWS
jgi:outer membrane lipase/esterase